MKKQWMVAAAVATVVASAGIVRADDPYGLKAAGQAAADGAKADAQNSADNAKAAAMKPVDDAKAQADAAKAKAQAAGNDAAAAPGKAVAEQQDKAKGAVNDSLNKATGGMLQVQ